VQINQNSHLEFLPIIFESHAPNAYLLFLPPLQCRKTITRNDETDKDNIIDGINKYSKDS